MIIQKIDIKIIIVIAVNIIITNIMILINTTFTSFNTTAVQGSVHVSTYDHDQDHYLDHPRPKGPLHVFTIFATSTIIMTILAPTGPSTFPHMEKLEELVLDKCDIRSVAEVKTIYR